MQAIRILCTTGAAMLLLPTAALPHAAFENEQAIAGTVTTLSLIVGHGCGASATNELRIKVPDGIDRLIVEHKPGWDISLKYRPLDEPYTTGAGQRVTETVDEITWSGGSLPDGYYGRFEFRALLPDAPDTTLWFRTIQSCDEGVIRWIEVPSGDGDEEEALAEPAPGLRLVGKGK